MKKTLLLLFCALGGLCVIPARADTTSVSNAIPPLTVAQSLESLKDAVFSNNTNWLVEAHGLYAPGLGNKYGFGVGYFYQVSTYVVAGTRLDYVDGGFVMPSGNATLQLPLHPLSSVTWLPTWLQTVQTTPFAYVGIGIPVSGATIGNVKIPGSVKDNNGEPTAIIGQGISVSVYAPTNNTWNISLVVDRETWSGFDGTQYRGGVLFHHHLPDVAGVK